MTKHPEACMPLDNSDYLARMCKQTLAVTGDACEVGVYRGGSALILYEQIKDTGKCLFLLDTFMGIMPSEDDYPLGTIVSGEFSSFKADLITLFKDKSKVHIIKGDCAKTLPALGSLRFSFVHIDVDLYTPTKVCLEFFLPRMSNGGIIMVHDYPFLPGVIRAVSETKLKIESSNNFAVIRVWV